MTTTNLSALADPLRLYDETFASRFSRRLYSADGVVSSSPRNGDPPIGRPEGPVEVTSEPRAPAESGSMAGAGEERDRQPAIVLQNVEKVYENAAGKFRALKSIDLQLNYGQFISIVGKSGCGKSTLLLAAGGLLKPSCCRR